MSPTPRHRDRARAARCFREGADFLSANQLEQAAEAFARAIAFDPGLAEAHVNLGFIAQRNGRFDQATQAYERAIAAAPSLAVAHFNLANLHRHIGRFGPAAAAYREALRVQPAYPEALLNLASVLVRQDELDEAEVLVRKALQLRPAYAEAHANLGNILLHQHRLDEAIAACGRSLELDPARAEVHLNKGYAHLLGGDFPSGWPEFEYRRAGAGPKLPPDSPLQLWRGAGPVAGRSILVHADGGMGDLIQFARYAPLLAGHGAAVHLELPAALAPLFTGLPFLAGVHLRGGSLPATDLHTAFLTLALAFDTRLDNVPPPLALAAPAANKARWRALLGPARPLRVGLVWAGSPEHRADHHRSMPFALFRRLTSGLGGVRFFSLQNRIREEDTAALAAAAGVTDLSRQGIGGFDDTAALVSAMDLVISVDTAIAHLAATMGRPVWLLLPHLPDWRWMLDREDSPWYPTIRLFRQPHRGDWSTVLERVHRELSAWAASASREDAGRR